MHPSNDPGCYKLGPVSPQIAHFELVERVWASIGDCADDVDPVEQANIVLETVLRARAAAAARTTRRVRLVL